MILDLRRQDAGPRLTTDLCIVGAGAAGITIAQSFIDLGVQVCLVESGGFDFEDDTQALYSGASIGQFVGLDSGRLRFLGGTTNHWGGRCAAFSAAELAQRSWVPDSGWPISLDDLQPYYRRARNICGFPSVWLPDSGILSAFNIPTADDQSPDIKTQIWHFAPHDGGVFWNFGKAYREKLDKAANIKLLLHANLTKLDTSAGASHIDKITVRSLTGTSLEISANHYVLCCGAVENARMMLAGGIGNDLVGRFFMQHLRADAATLFTTDRLSSIQDTYNDFDDAEGIQHEIGLALSEQAQRENGLLNCSALLQYQGDPEAGTTAAQDIWRRLREGQWTSDLGTKVWRIVRDLHALERNAERRLVQGRHPLLPLQAATVIVDIEQVPDRDSRITLGTELDPLGIPRVIVDWRLSPLEQSTARYFMAALGAEFARRGVGRLRLEAWLDAPEASWREAVSETCHHIGTTRMSADPRRGVVDANCAVHGVDNLFVAGSSVFPTGGHVNPTFMITALSLRLADHLKDLMGRRA